MNRPLHLLALLLTLLSGLLAFGQVQAAQEPCHQHSAPTPGLHATTTPLTQPAITQTALSQSDRSQSTTGKRMTHQSRSGDMNCESCPEQGCGCGSCCAAPASAPLLATTTSLLISGRSVQLATTAPTLREHCSTTPLRPPRA